MIRKILIDAYYGDEIKKVEISSHWEHSYNVFVDNYFKATVIYRQGSWAFVQTRSPKKKDPDIEEFTSADFAEIITLIEAAYPFNN